MKKLFALVIMSIGLITVKSQGLTPTVVSSAGGYTQNASSSLSYTIGEMTMVQTFSNNSNILTQGFQQPDEQINTLIDQTAADNTAFVLYPNPAVDNLWFGFQFSAVGHVSISLLNELGQEIAIVYEAGYTSGKEVQLFDVSKLAAGNYFLRLNFSGKDSGKTIVQGKKFIVIH